LRYKAKPDLNNVDDFVGVEFDIDPFLLEESEKERVEADFDVGVVPSVAADSHRRKFDLFDLNMEYKTRGSLKLTLIDFNRVGHAFTTYILQRFTIKTANNALKKESLQ